MGCSFVGACVCVWRCFGVMQRQWMLQHARGECVHVCLYIEVGGVGYAAPLDAGALEGAGGGG